MEAGDQRQGPRQQRHEHEHSVTSRAAPSRTPGHGTRRDRRGGCDFSQGRGAGEALSEGRPRGNLGDRHCGRGGAHAAPGGGWGGVSPACPPAGPRCLDLVLRGDGRTKRREGFKQGGGESHLPVGKGSVFALDRRGSVSQARFQKGKRGSADCVRANRAVTWGPGRAPGREDGAGAAGERMTSARAQPVRAAGTLPSAQCVPRAKTVS